MKKILLTGFVILLLTGFVSSSSVYYDSSHRNRNCHEKVLSNDWKYESENVESEKRYPTEDYRYGYSYRSTREYFREEKFEKREKRFDDRRLNFGEDSYTRYTPYLKKTEEIKCYHVPPKGKLFYVKCP